MSPGTSPVTVVVVTHNSAAVIGEWARCVSRVLADEACVLVVDNASTDESAGLAAHALPQLKTVRLPRNLGFGMACNAGAEAAESEWVVFMNPDVRLTRLGLPDQSGPYGVGAGLLRSAPDARPQFFVRRETGPSEDFVQETLLRFLPPSVAGHWPQRRTPGEWATGALMLVRRAEFLDLGGFDPRLFMYFEDRDLCRRYRRAELPIRLEPGLAGVHGAGGSTTLAGPRREALSFAGWLEYTGIWRGQAAANTAARRALPLLRLAARGGHWAGWSERAATKALQVEEMLDYLADLASSRLDLDNRALPHARVALRSALGGLSSRPG